VFVKVRTVAMLDEGGNPIFFISFSSLDQLQAWRLLLGICAVDVSSGVSCLRLCLICFDCHERAITYSFGILILGVGLRDGGCGMSVAWSEKGRRPDAANDDGIE